MTRETIGFLGTGLMGSRMAGRLLDAGHPLVVWNRSREKTEPLVSRGARRADSPREVGEAAEVTISMLLDEDALRAILEGEDGLLAALGPGRTHVDMSTIGAEASRAAAERIEKTGAGFLDCPVLGSIGPAEKGELILFVGGRDEVVDRCDGILSILGAKRVRAGAAGQANGLKIVANMMLARMVEALGEALSLGMGQGIPADTIHEMLQAGALASPMWDRKDKILAGEPPLHFPIAHMCKDLRLVSESANRSSLRLPAHDAVQGLFEEADRAGHGSMDYSWLARWILEQNGALDD
ncbi:MAG: NAD-binding protein [Candidatus Eisenbacteria bacterium]|nr:NAD-binding protein [Candidatus Latescibacterota bacterium]MBD3301389.1 NAD-binding protein [Candidatus Eisenbacteria bacterium]